MTEPTDEELERAERIKRLRAGEAVPRRERRRPAPPDATREPGDDADEASPGTGDGVGSGDGRGGIEGTDYEGPLQPDDLELPPDAPADLTVASLFLRTALKERLLRLEEHLDLRHGFRYDGELDGPRHVRPLALYLGVRQLDKLDAEEIYALFESIDEVKSP